MSISVDVYLSYLLSQQEVDLKADVRNAFPKWNEVAARNPYLQETNSTSNEEIWVTVANFGDPDAYAGTYIDKDGWAPYHINAATVFFNSLIEWNRAYDYTCYPTSTLPVGVACGCAEGGNA
jgi:hypothetical protein